MRDELTRLYPGPAVKVAHQGRYLSDPLVSADHQGPFIYSNFVTSIDGRIALDEGPDAGRAVPRSIANPRDWRLFQELAGRADILISSGRYLRDLGSGTAQDVLPVSTDDAFSDIHEWRRTNGLAAQPAVLVLSTSLDFPPPARLIEQGREVMILTLDSADGERRQRHEAAGAEVIGCPAVNGGVDGQTIRSFVAERGFRTVYSVTGPDVLATLASAGALDALFLTTVHRLLSGRHFASILRGEALDPAMDLGLSSLYLDSLAPDGVGQTFARYDRRPVNRD